MIEDVQRLRRVERQRSLRLPQRRPGGQPFVYAPRRTYVTEISIANTFVTASLSHDERDREAQPHEGGQGGSVQAGDQPTLSTPVVAPSQAELDRTSAPLAMLEASIGWRVRVSTVTKWLLVGAIVASAIYLGYDTYQTNAELKHRITALSSLGSSSIATPEQRQQAEGTDESSQPSNALTSYVVSPEMPRIITIAKIGVKARVLQMGINPDGSMQAPIGIYDAGWYGGSARPGTSGAAVIDAHSSGPTKQGLFGRLDELVVGDTIEVERGDGLKLKYRVINKESVAKDAVDMKKLLAVSGQAAEGLNLITCSGTWVKGQATYSNRTIVYSEKINE